MLRRLLAPRLTLASNPNGIYVAGLLLYSMLPSFSHLPLGICLLTLLPFVVRPLLKGRRLWQWLAMLLGLLAGAAAIYGYGLNWLSGDTLLSALLLLSALKWLEADSQRELSLLSYAAVPLTAVSSLYLSGLPALVYLLLGLLLLINALLALQHGTQPQRRRLTSMGQLLALALPVSAMLFVTMPRLQGPLWDLGIVMGLPIELVIDQNAKQQGVKGSLGAGQISRLRRSDEPVLVAEFEGAVPYKSRLYWRGAVFSHYNGLNWQLPSGWDNRGRLLQSAFKRRDVADGVLTVKSEQVSYKARVAPHGERWLYALDLPAGRSVESFVSGQFQLLAVRHVDKEVNYRQRAWLEYSGGRPLSAAERQTYLQLPPDANPRLIKWGQSALGDDPVQALRVHLAGGGYHLTETPDIAESKHNLDTFFFDRKEGGIEHLASATALVLRAAGVPTRLVSGYRGGSLIALTNFVVVRQGNAHVWVEAWHDKTGWQRVEAKDFVQPPKPEKRFAGQGQAKPKPTPAKTPTKTPEAKPAAPVPATIEPTAKKASKQGQRQAAQQTWLQRLSAGVETWILNYNPERQVELMHKSGLRRVDWKSLLAITLAGLLTLLLVYGALLKLGRRRHRDEVALAFERLNQALQKQGLECGPQECPQAWLQRLKALNLDFYPALEAVLNRYLKIRYANQTEIAESRAFSTDVKRLVAML